MRIIMILIGVICAQVSLAQKTPTLHFSKDATLKEAPPNIYAGNKIRVMVDTNFEATRITNSILNDRFTELNRVICGRYTELDRFLICRIEAIQNWISDHDVLITKYCFADDEEKFYSYFSSRGICDALQSNSYDEDCKISTPCREEECICYYFHKYTDSLIYYRKQYEDAQNRYALVRRLVLCNDTDRCRPYRFNNNGLGAVIEPGNSYSPETIETGIKYYINKEPLRYTNGSSTLDTVITIPKDKKGDLNLDLRAESGLQKTIIGWYNHIDKIPSGFIKQALDAIQLQAPNITLLRGIIDTCIKCTREDCRKLTSLLNAVSVFDTLWCPGSPLTEWLKHWLWVGGTNFKLNYLSFTEINPDLLKEKKELLKKIRYENELLAQIDSLQKCKKCKDKNSLERINFLLDEKHKNQEAIAAMEKRISDMGIEESAQSKNTYLTTIHTLHRLKLPVNNRQDRVNMLYLDANDNSAKTWRPFQAGMLRGLFKESPRYPRGKLIIPEDKPIRLGIFNSLKSGDSITLNQVKKSFNDTSRFITNAREIFNGLAQTAGMFSGNAQAINTLLNATFGSFPRPHVNNTFTTLMDSTIVPLSIRNHDLQWSTHLESSHPCNYDSLQKVIGEKLWRYDLLVRLLKEYNEHPIPVKLETLTEDKPGLFTYSKAAEDWSAPFTNEFTFVKDKKELASGKYSVGRQKLFSFSAGIMFNMKPAYQSTADTSGGGFKVTTSNSRSKFVCGVNIYPFHQFEADDAIIPKYPFKRLSLFGGFEITKPLENLYAGFGYDLVPGFKFSAGWHFYKKEYLKIQNNQVVDRTTSYQMSGNYLGFAVDPLVLTGIIKSFFK